MLLAVLAKKGGCVNETNHNTNTNTYSNKIKKEPTMTPRRTGNC